MIKTLYPSSRHEGVAVLGNRVFLKPQKCTKIVLLFCETSRRVPLRDLKLTNMNTINWKVSHSPIKKTTSNSLRCLTKILRIIKKTKFPKTIQFCSLLLPILETQQNYILILAHQIFFLKPDKHIPTLFSASLATNNNLYKNNERLSNR